MAKRIIFLAILVVFLGALCLFIFTGKPTPVQSVRRTDGSTITLVDVTYGSNHLVAWGKPYQRSLYKMLPMKFKWLSGAMVGGITAAGGLTNTPVFWLYDSRPQTNSPTKIVSTGPSGVPANLVQSGNRIGIRPAGIVGFSTSTGLTRIGSSPTPDVAYRVLDEYGCEHDPQGYSMGSTFQGFGGKLSHYQFNLGDPHCKIIGMCIYDVSSGSNEIEMGRFLVPDAVLKSLPTPSKESLSPPQQVGDLTVQMTSLVTGLPAEPFRVRKTNNPPVFTRATFHITKNGAPTMDWLPRRLQITDAKGKKSHAWSAGIRARQGDDEAVDFEGFLDPTNGPYKISAEFIRRSGFSSKELVTFTNVPFPTNSEVLTLTNLAAEVSGHRLTLERFYGAASERPQLNFNSTQPVVLARLDPEDDATHLQIVSVLDENHEELPHWGIQHKGKDETYLSFAPDTHAKSVTLNFAVHQSRFAEFEMMPVVISKNMVAKQ